VIARLRLRDIFGGKDRDGAPPPEDGQLRRIVLAGEGVEYRLIRARRRTIGMQVGLAGLTVRAPRWVSVREIEAALAERDRWVIRSLAEWRARRRDVFPPRLENRRADSLPRTRADARRTPRTQEGNRRRSHQLSVLHPAAEDERQVAVFVGRWLRDEALRLLEPRVADFAARVTTQVPTLKLSNARSEWGSCNHHGVIRLSCGSYSFLLTSRTTSSRTRSRIWSSSITRSASGGSSKCFFPVMRRRGGCSMTGLRCSRHRAVWVAQTHARALTLTVTMLR
jgi:predicted metal-dependent hydrolase